MDAPSDSVAAGELAAALRPSLCRFLLFAIFYFVFNTLFYRVAGDPGYVPALSGLTLMVLGVFYLYNHQTATLFRLELTGHVCSLLLVANGLLDIGMEYRPIKLMYLLLLLPAFAISAVTLRVLLSGSAAAFAGFLWAAWHYDRGNFTDCVWVGCCGLFIGAALSIMIRSTLLKAVRAKITSDRHRDEALTLARFDSLTGLANRRAFMAEVEWRLSRPGAFYLGLIDLDGFKPINDIYGHAAGDRVLSQVAGRLRRVCGENTFVARLGGDEFAVMLFEAYSESTWREHVDRLISELSRPYPLESEIAHISASAGFTLRAAAMDATSSKLMERADYALYEAKENGRGIAVLFDRTHEDLIRATKAVEQALRAIDAEKELSLAFQPQYDLRRNRVVAFEALARWHSERLGTVEPHMFIRAAERSGLITTLTPILLEKALKAARTWPTDLRLAFNLSARDLLSPVAVSRIVDVVQTSGVAAARIEFEITETAMLTDFAQARNGIARLTEMGCRIALDDFGSGYTHFSRIHQVRVDTVKIDRAFVLELERNSRARKIVKSMIELADTLGMAHVVEGVETAQELALLTNAGAVQAQGYLFARPMPAEEIEAFLAQQDAEPYPLA